MNAVEFVKKHGWEKAVEVIKNRPPMNSARYRPSDNKYSSTLSSGKAVCTVQLKRLVDSWELVEFCGGLDLAKKLDKDLLVENFEDIQKAIADVESVGVGCERI